MNEEKKVPFKWEYGEETISLQLGMYANNQRLYIGMITHTEDGAEAFADMTGNPTGYFPGPRAGVGRSLRQCSRLPLPGRRRDMQPARSPAVRHARKLVQHPAFGGGHTSRQDPSAGHLPRANGIPGHPNPDLPLGPAAGRPALGRLSDGAALRPLPLPFQENRHLANKSACTRPFRKASGDTELFNAKRLFYHDFQKPH